MLNVGEAIEQAQAALFLASDESSYITATVCVTCEFWLTLGFYGRWRIDFCLCHSARRPP